MLNQRRKPLYIVRTHRCPTYYLLWFACVDSVVQLCSEYVRTGPTTCTCIVGARNIHLCVLPKHVLKKLGFCGLPPRRGCEALCLHGESKLCSIDGDVPLELGAAVRIQ